MTELVMLHGWTLFLRLLLDPGKSKIRCVIGIGHLDDVIGITYVSDVVASPECTNGIPIQMVQKTSTFLFHPPSISPTNTTM